LVQQEGMDGNGSTGLPEGSRRERFESYHLFLDLRSPENSILRVGIKLHDRSGAKNSGFLPTRKSSEWIENRDAIDESLTEAASCDLYRGHKPMGRMDDSSQRLQMLWGSRSSCTMGLQPGFHAHVLKLCFSTPSEAHSVLSQPFFVLVLVLSAGGTRTRRYGIQYEYHFLEYEYERRRKSATLKIHTPIVEPAKPAAHRFPSKTVFCPCRSYSEFDPTCLSPPLPQLEPVLFLGGAGWPISVPAH
jgi:hypothetical protein